MPQKKRHPNEWNASLLLLQSALVLLPHYDLRYSISAHITIKPLQVEVRAVTFVFAVRRERVAAQKPRALTTYTIVGRS